VYELILNVLDYMKNNVCLGMIDINVYYTHYTLIILFLWLHNIHKFLAMLLCLIQCKLSKQEFPFFWSLSLQEFALLLVGISIMCI